MFEAFHEASVDINPEYWLLDHEIGTINALKEVFGNQTVVQGCRGGTQEISQRSILSGKYIFEVKKYFLQSQRSI